MTTVSLCSPVGAFRYGCAVYRYQKNIAVLKVTVLYTVGLLNTAVYRPVVLITFRVSRRRREMYCGHARLCACLYVCVTVRGRMPTQHDND